MKKRTRISWCRALCAAGVALAALLPVGALVALTGCPGVGARVACSRAPDGTVSCQLEAHRHEPKH